MNILLIVLVIIASVMGSLMAFPQARRIVRTRRIEGVSAVWIGVSIALNSWWLVYGIFASVWAVVPVSVISVGLYSTIAVAFLLSGGKSGLPGILLGLFGLGLVPLPFLLVGGWELAGVAVGLCYGLQLLPAVIEVFRSVKLAGVSGATWVLAALESAIWLVYGMAAGDAGLALAGVSGVVMAGVILVRLAVTGHRPFAVVAVDRRLASTR